MTEQKKAVSLRKDVNIVTVGARAVLSDCADVAKGARFYAQNFDCNDLAGGAQQFSLACLGLIAFALHTLDAHFAELDENHRLPREVENMVLSFDYSKPAKE